MTDKHLATCPTSRQLSAFVDGLLNHEADEIIAGHLAGCPQCETAVQLLESQSSPLIDHLSTRETDDPIQHEPQLQQAIDSIVNAARTPHTAQPSSAQPTAKPSASPEAVKKKAPLPAVPPNAAKSAPPSPKSGLGSKAFLIGGLVAAAGLAALYFTRPDPVEPEAIPVVTETETPKETTSPNGQGDPSTGSDIPPGFTLGKLTADTPVQKIRVKIRVGETGDALAEPVDLHLGFGFPLRLFPLGTHRRDPSFAAFPQTVSLASPANTVEPGTSIWFEFNASPSDDGLDELSNSPALLKGVHVGDIRQIGFASRGETNWTLDGYEISINDALFASHGEIAAQVGTVQGTDRVSIEEMLPKLQQLESEVETLQAYLDLGGVNADDQAVFNSKQAELSKLSQQLMPLAGRMAGTHPWYDEQDPGLKLASAARQPVDKLTIKLMTTGAQDSGTQNSVYLVAGPRKYPVSSAASPLASESGLQEYEIDPPLGPFAEDLREIGVGMLASDVNFGENPDRAQFQRIIIEAADKVVYDSELNPVDRSNLANFHLIPPAHRDDLGGVIPNESTESEIYVWRPGMALTIPEVPVPLIAEPPPPPSPAETPVTIGGLAALPFSKPLATKPPGDAPVTNIGIGGGNSLGTQPVTSPAPTRGGTTPVERLLSQLLQGLLRNQLAAQLAARTRPATPVSPAFVPAVTPTPTPAAPVISGVRFRSPTGVVIDTRPVTVDWTVTGNTASITHFEVILNPVAPHLTRPFIATPVAQDLRATGNQSTLTPNLTPLATSLTPGLVDQLWVQPLVRAKNSLGQTVGLAQTGPLLPLFTRKVAGPTVFSITPGPTQQFAWGVVGGRPAPLLPPTPLTPGYQVGTLAAPGDGFTPPWLPYRSISVAGGGTAVLPLSSPTTTHNGFLLDAFGSVPTFLPLSQNLTIKPSNAGEVVTVRFEASGVNLQQNMQLIGHLGFLNTQPGQAQMQVQMFVIVSDPARQSSLVPLIPNDGNFEVLRLVTTAPIAIAKLNAGGGPAPLGLLRVPINLNTPVSNYNTQLAPTFRVLWQRLSRSGVVPQNNVNITVIFMVNLTNPLLRNSTTAAFNNESIGIYGLRLVPQ